MKQQLIDQLQALALDTEFRLAKGISGADMTKPIALNDALFRKAKHNITYATAEDIPFEMEQTLDAFDCYAYKSALTTLGVLCFELLFSAQSYLAITLTQPQSEIKQLFVYLNRETHQPFQSFLDMEQTERYHAFDYFSQNVHKFALSQFATDTRTVHKEELPTFMLGCADPADRHTTQFTAKADQLIMYSSVTGLIQIGQLLLDMGAHANTANEVCLENPIHGFGGVSNKSIEAKFWLPNSIGFYTDDINALQFP